MNVVSLKEGNKQLICIVALKLLKNNETTVKNKLLYESSSLFHPTSKSPGGLYHRCWILLQLGGNLFLIVTKEHFFNQAASKTVITNVSGNCVLTRSSHSCPTIQHAN